MSKRRLVVGATPLLAILSFGTLGLVRQASAHTGAPLTGVGTATIDGVMGPGEWAGAGRFDFPVTLPGGSTVAATFLVMNDSANLYLAFQVARDHLDYDSYTYVWFDNDHDGVIVENGRDLIIAHLYADSGPTFTDYYSTNEPPCEPGHPPGYCSFEDTADGGTNDGLAAGTNNGSSSFFEISHPLDSADDDHDFSLAAGATVGFNVQFTLCPAAGSCGSAYIPAAGDGDIVIAATGALELLLGHGQTGSYHSGDTATITASINNPGLGSTVDLFFGAVLPNGHTVLCFTDLAFGFSFADLGNLAALRPLVTGLDLSAPFSVHLPALLSYQWQGGEPAGGYTFFLLAAVPGAFADGSVGAGEILELSATTLYFFP